MRSSSGEHYVGLDHLRALAAYLVFSWHFIHGKNGDPVAFEGAPAFMPFALIDEGHTGVSLFMTLSGYLFARLLDGKRIDYGAFLINRGLRLLPLLTVVTLAVCLNHAFNGRDPLTLLWTAAKGFVSPTWPNGGWSIAVELQFYLCLPVLLFLVSRSPWFGLAILAGATALRSAIFAVEGETQIAAYFFLIGRIDQFMLGILAARFALLIKGRHGAMALIGALFIAFYWLFDRAGGYYHLGGLPSPSPLWIILPTMEGAAYAALIAWYDRSFAMSRKGFSGYLARIGEYSYSIYLLHGFVAFDAGALIDQRVMDISNFHVALAWSLPAFALMALIGKASYLLIEKPFLTRRRPYLAPLEGSAQPLQSGLAAVAARD